MSFARQLKVLIRKNFILKKRLWKQTIWEFIIPLLFGYIISLLAGNTGGIQELDFGKVYLISLTTTLIFQPMQRFILMQMVVDKETKMRESLRIMSMKNSAYSLSYYISQLIFVVFISAIMAVVFGLNEFIQGAANLFAFFLLMIFYGTSMTFFSMALTTLFSDSKISVQLGSLATTFPLALFIGLYNMDRYNPWRLYLGYIFPHFPSTVVVCKMANLQIDIDGYIAVASLILQAPFYYFVYIYLDAVMPDTYGIKRSACFCLRRKRSSPRSEYQQLISQNAPLNGEEPPSAHYMPVPSASGAPIVLDNLSKHFGAFKAVD